MYTKNVFIHAVRSILSPRVVNYRSSKTAASLNGTDAFVKTSEWLQENYKESISATGLQLQEWFRGNIIISVREGKCNMIASGKNYIKHNIELSYTKKA